MLQHYRAVNTISERNAILCDERVDGMLVTVKNMDGKNYITYMMKSSNPCDNSGWKEFNPIEEFSEVAGLYVIDTNVKYTISIAHLNTFFPNVVPGYRVVYTKLNTIFMKLNDNQWTMTNYTKLIEK